MRSAPAQAASQPGPYWAIDSGPIRIIGIDTGLLGGIDREQGEWLRRVSRGPRPKILVTGSPIYVDGEHHPCAIEGGGTVDEVVRDPECTFVAVVGGDIHNYQRYPVDVDGRRIEYVVSGGGGAFMHATHTIPRVEVGGVTEDRFRCYPMRGDSLAFYSRLYGRRLRLRRLFDLTPDEASAVLARRLGVPATRATGARVTLRTRFVASVLGAPPARTAGAGCACPSAGCSPVCCRRARRRTARRSSRASCGWTSARPPCACGASPPRACSRTNWTRPSRTTSPSRCRA